MASNNKSLLPPLIGSGILMAAYLLLRPYGDAASGLTAQAAAAFADWRWVAAHVAGLLSVACLACVGARLHLVHPSLLSRLARTTGLVGLVLVLPYYGAETFALHVIGQRATAGDFGLLVLVEEIRNQAVAITMFGIGLICLAVCACLLAYSWQRSTGSAWAWPLGVVASLFLPQFYLPPVGRMAYGVAFAATALVWAIDIVRRRDDWGVDRMTMDALSGHDRVPAVHDPTGT